MSNSHPNHLGSRPIFVWAWMVRCLVSVCVCVYCRCYSWLVTAVGDDLWRGGGEFYPYAITYRLLNMIMSFCICHVCVEQNDGVIVYRRMILEQFDNIKNGNQKAQTEEGQIMLWPTEEMVKKTNTGLWSTTQNTEEWAKRILKTEGEYRCSGSVRKSS
jgi:hypothetical protein